MLNSTERKREWPQRLLTLHSAAEVSTYATQATKPDAVLWRLGDTIWVPIFLVAQGFRLGKTGGKGQGALWEAPSCPVVLFFAVFFGKGSR